MSVGPLMAGRRCAGCATLFHPAPHGASCPARAFPFGAGAPVDRVRNNGEARQAGYSFPPWPVNPPRTLPHGVVRRVPHLFFQLQTPEIHMKKRILRGIFTTVTCDARTFRHFFGNRDEILNAEEVPKLLLMPTTWRGDLVPVLDAYLEQLRPLENGLTLGRTLTAEEVPATLDLGTQWLGTFRDRMLSYHSDAPGAVCAMPVLQALEAVRAEMRTGDRRRVADALKALRRAADCMSGDDEEHGAFSEGRRIADAARHRIADMNQRAADFWNKRSATAQLDSSGRMNWRGGDAAPGARSTAFRDAMHAAAHASTPREQIASLNSAAKAFWNSGEPPTVTGDALRRMPAPSSIGEMNARNRAFWASRL